MKKITEDQKRKQKKAFNGVMRKRRWVWTEKNGIFKLDLFLWDSSGY